MSKPGVIIYSNEIVGDESNHDQPVRFDWMDGYTGITQGKDRVLLTPEQFRALITFVRNV